MPKKNFEVRMVSYGLYTPFEKGSRGLPHVLEFTDTVPARLGVEFGYILHIRKARGEMLEFTIEHPPFPDESGQVTPPFAGAERISASDYQFFLGDTLWEPLEDKLGDWTLTAWIGEQEVARKTFHVVQAGDADNLPTR
ncbi:MAG: DUF3859 domain-containing protein [Phycisphaerae bacterium]